MSELIITQRMEFLESLSKDEKREVAKQMHMDNLQNEREVRQLLVRSNSNHREIKKDWKKKHLEKDGSEIRKYSAQTNISNYKSKTYSAKS